MQSPLRFWRNVTLIGVAHAAVVVGLIRWSGASQKPASQKIVWLAGTPGGGMAIAALAKTPAPEPAPAATVAPEANEEDQPALTLAKSEIQLPAATPTPAPTATPKPKPSVTPAVKATPARPRKLKPRPTATPKPRPSARKLVLAKASPRPTPQEEDRQNEPVKPEAALQTPSPVEAAPVVRTADNAPKSAGSSGATGGGGSESQFGWYGSMLHDRFYSEWAQPTNVDLASVKNSVLVKLRIEKDGRVSNFELVRPSGNAAVDESVRAAAKRVTQVDPLPEGLGTGDHYDVKIKFELSSD